MRSFLLAALLVPILASAASNRAACKQACTTMIDACGRQNTAAGFGNLAKACKTSVLQRCRNEGTAACTAFCGNGTIDGSEACDGSALGTATCATQGFASGTLACTAACTVDVSGCTPKPPSLCGNNGIDAGESCDGTAFGTATCESLGFLLGGTLQCTAGCGFDVSSCLPLRVGESGQTIAYTADKNDGIAGPVAIPDDGTVQPGKSLAYRDNQDGTITDLTTGLMWEKKGDDDGLHDKDKLYTWSGNGAQETIWDWLDDVNAEGGTGFAGHADWRVPNVRELATLVSYGFTAPAIEPAFATPCTGGCAPTACSCTPQGSVASSTTQASDPLSLWGVDFETGAVGTNLKGLPGWYVRAVRGGT